MAPIPSSDLRGHERLRERIVRALNTCIELPSVEFKRSASWDELKWKIVRTALGMGNLRDGGVIIVGVKQNGGAWEANGISNDHLITYDPDIMIDAINLYASPPMQPEIVKIEHEERVFLAVQIPEFNHSPHVCKKDSPNGVLKKASIYTRPLGVPKTVLIEKAEDLHDLLELAAEKRAMRFLQTAKRVGFRPPNTDSVQFDDELGDLL